MKKVCIFVLVFFIFVKLVFAESPISYVKNKYGENAVYYSEDTDDWLDDDKIGSKSPIYFYNTTEKEITFELHEIKTKFGSVTTDKVFPIKGRTKKITVKPNEYFNTVITLDDIEHFVFLFDEEPPKIYTYADNISINKETTTDGFILYGFVSVSTSTEYFYSLVFEFAEE